MSKKDSKHLEHAIHNLKAHEFLVTRKEEFPDWVVTTAFYAAYHFLIYKIFPFKESHRGVQTTYNTINDYFDAKKASNPSVNQHRAAKDLIALKCTTEISNCYENIFNTCHTARYSYFNIDIRLVDRTISDLQKIKKYCKPN